MKHMQKHVFENPDLESLILPGDSCLSTTPDNKTTNKDSELKTKQQQSKPDKQHSRQKSSFTLLLLSGANMKDVITLFHRNSYSP